MKAKTRIQMLRIWLAAIMIIIPAAMLAESRNEAGSIVVQDESTATAQLSTTESEAALKAARKAARRTLRGYRGFVEAGGFYNVGVKYYHVMESFFEGNKKWHHSTLGSKFELSTTHGYQFNNYLFLGAGVAIDGHFKEGPYFNVPIFVDARVNVLNRKVSPTIGVKFGGAVGKFYGVYVAASLGCRIAITEKTAIIGGVEFYCDYAVHQFVEEETAGVGLKVGYEF